ncbi:MrcB family domain-containing protein [Sphingomonas sp. RS2018]
MREKFAEVLDLQLEYSSLKTPSMDRRGLLIRNAIPDEMRLWLAAAMGAADPFKGRLNVQGRDGTGPKTFIPWVRIHSPELSPSATKGWYAVYLFEADGGGVHLCISHGSTRFDGSAFIQRRAEEIAPLMMWSRNLLGAEAAQANFGPGINLGSKGDLAIAYEASTAFSRRYARDALPDDSILAEHAARAVSLLGQLYRSIELGHGPEADPPEIAAAQVAIEEIGQPLSKRKSGQSFGLTGAERRLVELHAMTIAQGWLSDNGFTSIRDVSAKRPTDFEAKKEGLTYSIEVKGTTAGPDTILLTRNEVELHQHCYPANVLIVVHSIHLLDMRKKAAGGELLAKIGWKIESEALNPIAFRCAVEWP